MYKYDMVIDGESYKAVFMDHFEAADFIDLNEHDGSKVIVNGYKAVTPAEVWADDDFSQYYAAEVIVEFLCPEFLKTHDKSYQCVDLVKQLALNW